MKQGLLVTFEGIEGCGKSTQLRLAADWLSRKGFRSITTREPGGTEIGVAIRKILLSESSVKLSPLCEALLYMADRFQHITEVIKPHLSVGDIVLTDRYHDSTLAYQGYGRSIPIELLDQIWRLSGISIDPDLSFIFDLDPEIGLQRSLQKLKNQRLDESRFEKEELEFHKRVRQGFLELAKAHSSRFVIVDGRQNVEKIHQQVITAFEKKLN